MSLDLGIRFSNGQEHVSMSHDSLATDVLMTRCALEAAEAAHSRGGAVVETAEGALPTDDAGQVPGGGRRGSHGLALAERLLCWA